MVYPFQIVVYKVYIQKGNWNQNRVKILFWKYDSLNKLVLNSQLIRIDPTSTVCNTCAEIAQKISTFTYITRKVLKQYSRILQTVIEPKNYLFVFIKLQCTHLLLRIYNLEWQGIIIGGWGDRFSYTINSIEWLYANTVFNCASFEISPLLYVDNNIAVILSGIKPFLSVLFD